MLYYAIKEKKTGRLYAGRHWPGETCRPIWADADIAPVIFGRPQDLPPDASAAILDQQARIIERRIHMPEGSMMVVPVELSESLAPLEVV